MNRAIYPIVVLGITILVCVILLAIQKRGKNDPSESDEDMTSEVKGYLIEFESVNA